MEASICCREVSPSDLPQVLGLYSQPGFDGSDALPLSDAARLFEKICCYADYRLYVSRAPTRRFSRRPKGSRLFWHA